MKTNAVDKAYEIIKGYNGYSNYMKYLQYKVNSCHYILNDFDIEYIINNKDFVPYELNKTVKISVDFGRKLNEKFLIGFTPEKIRISSVIGEMGNSFHCYIQYRQSVPPVLTYVNKNNILTPLETVDYNTVEVDFDKYDKSSKDGRKLKILQKEGIKFLLANRKCILADSMGTGKTTQSIIAAMASNSKKILIITTASLKTNWKRELTIYNDEKDIQILQGSKDEICDKKYVIANYDILINYYEVPTETVYETEYVYNENGKREVIRKTVMVKSKDGQLIEKQRKSTRKDVIEECLKNSPLFLNKFDCVIIDEAQKLSNNSSNRYKVIDDFLKRAKPNYVFLLTGTPLTNKPINLYYILKLIDAPITRDYRYFIKRYCDAKTFRLKTGKEVTTINGASNLEELREKIKHLYIRRLLTEMTDMVDKNIITKTYDLTESQRVEYERLWQEYLDAQTEQGNEDSEQYRQLVEGILVRQYLAKQMVDNTIKLVDNMLEEGGKVIIVCTFSEEIAMFKDYYKKKCVVYDGKMTAKAKDKAEQAFNNDKNVRVFIGQILAAGVGLNLVVANKMVFNSYSWVAADNAQIEDRIYRLTQKNDVTCVYQLFNDSMSKHMYDTVIGKKNMMDTIIKSEINK
jgi:SWI/SNF-related matrix-associated actin-dependent regulator 1 of chromatin subfamily A